MMLSAYKKLTFVDKWDKKYACWPHNNPKAWRYWKKKARREFRQIARKEASDGYVLLRL